MDIACVLTRSPQFGDEHVRWLKAQCDKYLPHDRFIVGSDAPVEDVYTIHLREGWPKWWAKMELYKHLQGPTLVLDLDTVILQHFEFPEEALKKSWVLRHFTRDGFRAPEEFGCGIMLTTDEFRKKVYNHFITDPLGFMAEVRDDDQKYFKKYWDKELSRFQDEFPDVFVSYKMHVCQHGLNPDNVFVAFHGLPRPWQIKEPWIPSC